jgi:hypothetical protein
VRTTAKGKVIDTTKRWRIVTMAAEFVALAGSRHERSKVAKRNAL